MIQTKQIQTAICVGHHYPQTNTNKRKQYMNLPKSSKRELFFFTGISIYMQFEMLNQANNQNEDTFFSF